MFLLASFCLPDFWQDFLAKFFDHGPDLTWAMAWIRPGPWPGRDLGSTFGSEYEPRRMVGTEYKSV